MYEIAIFFVCFLIAVKLLIRNKTKFLIGKHVVITGGSSGIGKSLAILVANKGAHVTIIARDEKKLQNALNEIIANRLSDDQKITSESVNVSNYKQVENIITNLETSVGPIYMLINCAGFARCDIVENFTEVDAKLQMDTNYFGTLYPIQIIVPRMKKRKDGIIVITASQAALIGMYGCAIYSSTKFALRGLAESIRMELKPYNISVTLALPPDTDTPGFEIENLDKPMETKIISESAGLYQPEQVARRMLDDALVGRFYSYIGFESFLLTTLCAGMTQISSFFELTVQLLMLAPARLIGVFYLMYFDRIIYKCNTNKREAPTS